MRDKKFSFHTVVLSWACLWMLAAPLFHVHPEADHRHGEEGHHHGGTVHTAWSPDLDCEFECHRPMDGSEASEESGTVEVVIHAGSRHTEFSLSLLNDSAGRKPLKPFFSQVPALSPPVVSSVGRYARIQRDSEPLPSSVPHFHGISSRAPPRFLV